MLKKEILLLQYCLEKWLGKKKKRINNIHDLTGGKNSWSNLSLALTDVTIFPEYQQLFGTKQQAKSFTKNRLMKLPENQHF